MLPGLEMLAAARSVVRLLNGDAMAPEGLLTCHERNLLYYMLYKSNIHADPIITTNIYKVINVISSIYKCEEIHHAITMNMFNFSTDLMNLSIQLSNGILDFRSILTTQCCKSALFIYKEMLKK